MLFLPPYRSPSGFLGNSNRAEVNKTRHAVSKPSMKMIDRVETAVTGRRSSAHVPAKTCHRFDQDEYRFTGRSMREAATARPDSGGTGRPSANELETSKE